MRCYAHYSFGQAVAPGLPFIPSSRRRPVVVATEADDPMWLNLKDHDATARLMATRWNLKIDALAAVTPRAFVYRVKAPEGPAALKLYKQIVASGEGAAIPFLRELGPDIGANHLPRKRIATCRFNAVVGWTDPYHYFCTG